MRVGLLSNETNTAFFVFIVNHVVVNTSKVFHLCKRTFDRFDVFFEANI